jgi:hypothetical protein
MKSVKVLRLFCMRPGVVPGFAELAAAADVGNSKGYAAVEQAKAIRIEVDGDRDAVAAIAVEQERSGTVAGGVAARLPARWECGRRRSGGVEAFADVLRWIVAAEEPAVA